METFGKHLITYLHTYLISDYSILVLFTWSTVTLTCSCHLHEDDYDFKLGPH